MLEELVPQADAQYRGHAVVQLLALESMTSASTKDANLRKVAAQRSDVEEQHKRALALVSELRELLDAAHHAPLTDIERQLKHGPFALRSWRAQIDLERLPLELLAKRGGGKDARGLRRGLLVRSIAEHLPLELDDARRNAIIAGLLRTAGDASIKPQHVASILGANSE